MRALLFGRLAARGSSAVAAAFLGAGSALLGVCGPFTDVSDPGFCPFVLEIFYLGITTGTTPTTYDPAGNVTRLQMAAFLSRGVDGILQRGSRRALVKKFWTPQNALSLGVTTLGIGQAPGLVECDGKDVWATGINNAKVWRVRGSDGRFLETWTGADAASGVVVAMGRVIVTGHLSPGRLYRIDPSQPAGVVTTVASNLGNSPDTIAFDGARFWTANIGGGSGVSIVTPGAVIPWTVTTVTTGFVFPAGTLYDGSNIWVTDAGAGKLLRLDANGAILQTVTVGSGPFIPAFDGTNLWVPNSSPDSVSVVRASTGAILATLTGNGMNGTNAAAFDGQHVLVTNGLGGSVSLWKAADLTPLGSFATGGSPAGACSDGISFWIGLNNGNRLARF